LTSCTAKPDFKEGDLRAKLISTINYVDKGQNKGQLRDFPLFFKKPWFSMVNDVGLTYPTSLFFLPNHVKTIRAVKPRKTLVFWF